MFKKLPIVRNLATTLVAATAAFSLFATSAQAADDHPLFFGWTGYDAPELYPEYVKKHGDMFRFTAWGDEEEGVTKLQSGFNADVIFPCNYKIKKWYATGKLAPLDTSRIKNWDKIMPSLKKIDGAMQDGKPIWVPIDWGQTSIVYRTDLAPEYENNETWAMLWDKKYKGRVAAFDSLVDAVVIAGLMADIPDMWNYEDDAHVAATKVKMKEMVDQVRFFSNDPTTLEQAIASGEVVAATVWNESVTRLKKQGLPVKYMNPKEGAMTWVCGLSMIKGSKHEDRVYDIINAMLDKESRVWEINEFGYGVSTQEAFEAVDSDLLAELGLSKNPDDILSAGIFQSEIQGESKLQEMFDEVKAGL